MMSDGGGNSGCCGWLCVLVAIVTVVVVALTVDGDDSAKVNNGQPDATAPVLVVPTQLPSNRDGYVRKPSSTADDDGYSECKKDG